MKRRISLFICCVFYLVLIFSGFSFSAQTSIVTLSIPIGASYMDVNGVRQDIGNEPPAVIVQERTLMPIRRVVEAIGGTADWDEIERKITVSVNNNIIEIWMTNPQYNEELMYMGPDKPYEVESFYTGSKNMSVNNEMIENDVAPIIYMDRLFMPLRFVVENVGCQVSWHDPTKTVTVLYTSSDIITPDPTPLVPTTAPTNSPIPTTPPLISSTPTTPATISPIPTSPEPSVTPITPTATPVLAPVFTPINNGIQIDTTLLSLKIQYSPYTYEVIEKSSGETLLIHSSSEFSGSATNLEAVEKKRTTNSIELEFSQESGVTFTFEEEGIIKVILSNTGANKITEEFVDQGEHYYGLWEYPYGGAIDNRGADHVFIGTNKNPGVRFCNARAPFYSTSKKYGIYADCMSNGSYSVAVNGKTRINFDTNELMYYVLYGPSYKDILNKYNVLAGPPVVPPLWAYGSFWWWDDEGYGVGETYQDNVINTADRLIEHQIPASAIWTDRPFTNGEMGWGEPGFSDSFPDPQQMINDLNSKGYEYLIWVANRCAGTLYREGTENDYLFDGEHPAADLRRPEVYDWFKEFLNGYVEMGIKGYKIDRGAEGEMPDSVQNEMVYLFAKLTTEGQREINGDDHYCFARNAYDRSRQYVGVWNGDTECNFSGLQVSIKNGLRCGAINFPMYGSDIGGYDKGNPTKDLFARWFAFGAYCPSVETKLHPERVIWLDYDQELIDIVRKHCKNHHELIPYTRSYVYEANQTGVPVMRQLIFEYPDDEKLYDMWDEYMYGAGLLIAPVYKDNATERSVYFPAGKWLDYNDKKTTYTGPTDITASAPLDIIPTYVKEGAIIPRGNILKGNDNWTPNWSPSLEIEFFPSITGESIFDYYNGTEVKKITCSSSGNSISISFDDLGTDGKLLIYCDGCTGVSMNGTLLTKGSDYTYDETNKLLTIDYSGSTNLQIDGAKSIF